MKSKQLKIEKPCSESWDKMIPTDRGRFCDKCSKNVVDLTHKSPTEIFKIYKESKGSMCGRIRPSQLRHPMPEEGTRYGFEVPYGKAAAGLMIAASVLGVEEIHAQTPKTEVVQTESLTVTSLSHSQEINEESNGNEQLPVCPVKQFSGKVTARETGKPLVHARVSLVTTDKVYSTFTDENGMYNLNLPPEIIADQNIISFSFDDIVRDENKDEMNFGEFYESSVIMVDAEDICKPLNHEAEEEMMILGGLIGHRPGQEPRVYHNGREINRKDLYDLKFDYATGFVFFLNPEMATALLGKRKGQYGASLYFDGEEVLE